MVERLVEQMADWADNDLDFWTNFDILKFSQKQWTLVRGSGE